MAEENKDEFESAYDQMATEEPAREVDASVAVRSNSLSEAEDESPSTSDIKSILRVLTPQWSDKILNEQLQPIMVSRVFPDNYLDSCKMMVYCMAAELPPDKPFNVWGLISAVHAAHSIGYEGRGIIDRLELAGVAHEQEMEKLSKELGLN